MHKSQFLFKTYLKELKYNVTDEMSQRLLSDPNKEIVALTNTLDYFNIEHIVANVPKEALDQLPNSFIAQISNGQIEKIVLATKGNSENIKIQIEDKKDSILSRTEFLNEWTGFVLAIEENKNKIVNTRQIIINSIVIVAILFATTYMFLVTNSVLKTIYLILSFTGIQLSYFIIREKFNGSSAFSKFCKLSKNTDCQSVLKSKESKLFNIIDLSDASLLYFSFLTLVSIYNPNTVFLFYISTLSLPMVLYSIYHQYFNIKKWCPLCLAIASVLILQFFAVSPIYEALSITYITILQFAFILSFLTLGWIHLKPLLTAKQENNALKIENLTFRRNHNLFLPYYDSLTKIDKDPDAIHEIVIGSKNPIVTITAITNPLCKSCIEAHHIYTNLLNKYPNELQINFRFLVPFKNRNDFKTQIAERLLQLYFEEDNKVFEQAFSEWYKIANTNEWLSKWGLCKDALYNNMLSKQAVSCLNNDIDSTPRILINNKLFPETYHSKDIENFIEPIIEFEKNEISKEINNIHA